MGMGTQAPAPSQVDVAASADGPVQRAPQAPFGSVAAATGMQAPRFPGTAHDLQPPQASAQQTPCAQWVLMQSASAVQLWPSGVRLVQELPWQVSLPTQSSLRVQVVRQAAADPQT